MSCHSNWPLVHMPTKNSATRHLAATSTGMLPEFARQVHRLMQQDLLELVASLPAECKASAEARMQTLTLDWLVGVMGRLHLNIIR